MNQGFRFNYQNMRDNDPDQDGENHAPDKAESYNTASTTRNVCFELPDGKRLFLNYSYLVSGEYLPEDNRITLAFTSHTVTMDGIHLEKLYDEFMAHIPRYVVCADQRYNSITENENPVVNKIIISFNA